MTTRLKILHSAILCAFTLILLYLHTTGFATSDEGWILQSANRLATGEIVYKDFQFIYHPGVLYVNAVAFKMLGTSILTSRIVAFTNSLVAIGLIYLITKQNRNSLLVIVTIIASYIFWGAGHINFSWPVMFCLTTALATIYLWQRWQDHKSLNVLIWIGALSAITLLFKQNFGLAITLVNGVFILLFIPKKIASLVQYSVGFLTIVTMQFVYFLSTSSLSWYIADMRYLLIEQIFLKGVLDSQLPWMYPAPLAYRLLKALLYLSPFMLSATTIYIAWKSKHLIMMYYGLLLSGYYLLSIRPTTDYVHLAPLLAFSCVAIAFLVTQFHSLVVKRVLFALLFGLASFGAYSALLKNYYRWDPPLSTQTEFSNDPQALIRSDQQSNQNLSDISSYIEKYPNEKYLFVYSFSPQFNVLLEKQNPTRYDYLHTGVLSVAIEQEVIESITNKNVQLVLTDVVIASEHDSIAKFIETQFYPVKSFGRYTLWQKKVTKN